MQQKNSKKRLMNAIILKSCNSIVYSIEARKWNKAYLVIWHEVHAIRWRKIGRCGGDPLNTIINLHMIGSGLSEAREKRHLTQAEMAEKLEIHTIPMIILSGIPNSPAWWRLSCAAWSSTEQML